MLALYLMLEKNIQWENQETITQVPGQASPSLFNAYGRVNLVS